MGSIPLPDIAVGVRTTVMLSIEGIRRTQPSYTLRRKSEGRRQDLKMESGASCAKTPFLQGCLR